MIRHCVWVKFRSDVLQAERDAIYAQLAALKDHLPGMLGMSAGPNVSPEGMHQGFADGFAIDFADVAARDAYLVDDAHKRAGNRLAAALEGGRAGVIVFDIEV
jgi:hypothetical protein